MTQSSVFMPPHAPLAALAFLGAAAGTVVALLAVVVLAVAGRRRVALGFAGGAATIVAGYAFALLTLSLTAREVRLAPGARKYFCEIDCHLAYSVESVSSAAVPHGRERLLVEVRTWFDETTIAPGRGDGPLTPNPRVAWLVDKKGRLAPPVAEDPPRGLARPLQPGASYTTRLAFEPPAGAGPFRLLVADPPGIEQLLLSHENGLLHPRIYFDLPEAPASRS